MPKTVHINNEYEARAMISEKQFKELEDFFNASKNNKQIITNVNSYFDTDERDLMNQGMVLRTRKINDSEYELTLKIKGEESDKEYNLHLSESEYESLIKDFRVDNEDIINEIKSRNIKVKDIKYITALKTTRYEITYNGFDLLIDKNEYKNTVDFNIEVESDSKNNAIRYLKEISKHFGIKYKKDYVSKSRRALSL